MNNLRFLNKSDSVYVRIVRIFGLTCRVFLPLGSVTHSSARPRLSVVILNISIP